VTDEQLSQFVGKADLNLIRPDRGFWTKDDHREFEDSEFGDFCRTCLDAGAYALVRAFAQQTHDALVQAEEFCFTGDA
jgi:hypothetical protein